MNTLDKRMSYIAEQNSEIVVVHADMCCLYVCMFSLTTTAVIYETQLTCLV